MPKGNKENLVRSKGGGLTWAAACLFSFFTFTSDTVDSRLQTIKTYICCHGRYRWQQTRDVRNVCSLLHEKDVCVLRQRTLYVRNVCLLSQITADIKVSVSEKSVSCHNVLQILKPPEMSVSCHNVLQILKPRCQKCLSPVPTYCRYQSLGVRNVCLLSQRTADTRI